MAVIFTWRGGEVIKGEISIIDPIFEKDDAVFSYLFAVQKEHLISLAMLF